MRNKLEKLVALAAALETKVETDFGRGGEISGGYVRMTRALREKAEAILEELDGGEPERAVSHEPPWAAVYGHDDGFLGRISEAEECDEDNSDEEG